MPIIFSFPSEVIHLGEQDSGEYEEQPDATGASVLWAQKKPRGQFAAFRNGAAPVIPWMGGLDPSDTFLRLFTLAFATGSFPDGEQKAIL